MSNRVRILFHCALEGPLACHVGNRALKAMEILVKNAPALSGLKIPANQMWISHEDWCKRGRPIVAKKKLNMGPFGAERWYLLTTEEPKKAPAQKPALKNLLEEAQWLWENLPQRVKTHCQLKIIREGRHNRWRRSCANPAYWGWQKPRESAVSTSPAQTGLSQTDFYSGAGQLAGTGPQVPADPEPWTVPSPLSAAAADLSFQALLASHNKIEKQAVTNAPKVGPSFGKKAPAPKSVYARFKTDSIKPSDEDGELLEGPDDDSKPKSAKSKPSKPLLRLGIWA